ncbi:putative nuclease HARBI1 [Eriocheir sinensis]|uniref:putative nuclease HARBI1 n=1 Tax=Eriocheir sinensis TaxID=95602 RepID=UPI0021C62474|nr:putative nuclease HARBI1 [Eriocheir sinensis]XP_050693873.1 putative nuclease HARBI1 [Eriocheir sinensis]
MEPNMFKELLDRVGPHIEKQDTFWRKSLSPGLRLAITLRYLATGESYKSLQYGFRVAHNTISLIIPETCEAIFQEYKHEVLSCPKTPDEWKKVASLFSKRWHFHHTVGALDGKHIAIRCPPNGGSRYYNYKGFHSIVLMAVADADYKFLFCDVGATGCSSDGGIFSATTLREALEKNTIGLPAPEPLPGDDKPIPFFLVGDDAFPLREWMMKPFPSRNLGRPERIFNYRLSRARRIIENAFGIMASRFRCLLTTIPLHPCRVESVVLACCTLHNLMRVRYRSHHDTLMDEEDPQSHAVTPGAWRDGDVLTSLEPLTRNTANTPGKALRSYLRGYVCSPAGSVPWQEDKI